MSSDLIGWAFVAFGLANVAFRPQFLAFYRKMWPNFPERLVARVAYPLSVVAWMGTGMALVLLAS